MRDLHVIEIDRILSKSVGPVEWSLQGTFSPTSARTDSFAEFYVLANLGHPSLQTMTIKKFSAPGTEKRGARPSPNNDRAAGILVPHNGSPPVIQLNGGRLVCLSDKGSPVTPFSPLDMTIGRLVDLAKTTEPFWMAAFLESRRTLNEILAAGGGALLEKNTDNMTLDHRIYYDVTLHFSPAIRGALTSTKSNIGETLIFGLVKHREHLLVEARMLNLVSIRDRVVGYAPTAFFSEMFSVYQAFVPLNDAYSLSKRATQHNSVDTPHLVGAVR